MSNNYFQISFTGVATITAEDEFEAGMKFKDMEISLPSEIDIDNIKVLDI